MNIGPYEIISEIGRGGMGVVYKATDPRTGQFVAVKMITGMFAGNPRSRMGLVREARLASQLQHPHIVTVHEIGQHKGALFIVMEYLEGTSVDRIVKHRSDIPVAVKLNAVIQLCAGLSYAHAQGVVHRDIKPANLFMLTSGSLKIVDFGLAKLNEMAGLSATKDTNTRFAGTVAYMSPEQLNGASADIRSDLWSVGVTLYELLTYALPFSGSSLGTLVKSVESDPVPPLPDSTPVRVELAQILDRALAKDPNVRYSTAEVLAIDLREALLKIHAAPSELQQAPKVDVEPADSRRPAFKYELGLDQHTAGRVRFRATTFTQAGWLECVKQSLGKADLRFLPGLGLLFTAEIFFWFWRFRGPRSSLKLALEVAGVFLGITASVVGPLVFGARRANATIRRKCQSCSRRMVPVSKWTRYVTSRDEIGWGLRDCIATLRDGRYEDAVSLLTVHGADNSEAYCVFRYNLEFWSCRACADQSALLTVEEKIDRTWRRQNLYRESYKYAVDAPVPAFGLVGRPTATPPRKKKTRRSDARVKCPIKTCGWVPGQEDKWLLPCGHLGNIFEMGGLCPSCSLQYTEAPCLLCKLITPLSDWYEG